ncbi:hypothetical protein AG1IA_08049 [Rhizoctonia solani AG-1 IA]|uniref:Uncharacterized protein n=1 Tax=Thanatephorus cucumeris (strain AG1-IA) TaxID=983506 RepID=L8WI90_THACA|nr:hypothetical protein AG1IA_08049 [Rhizoctonia solani AG-1 IA]
MFQSAIHNSYRGHPLISRNILVICSSLYVHDISFSEVTRADRSLYLISQEVQMQQKFGGAGKVRISCIACGSTLMVRGPGFIILGCVYIAFITPKWPLTDTRCCLAFSAVRTSSAERHSILRNSNGYWHTPLQDATLRSHARQQVGPHDWELHHDQAQSGSQAPRQK